MRIAIWLVVGLAVPGWGLHAPRAKADAHVFQGALRADGLAAVVGGLAPGPGVISIYRSDVELRARLALLRAGGEAAALGQLPASLLRASLEETIGEALIATESARLSMAKPSPEDVRRERQRLALGAGGEPRLAKLLQALGVSERELEAIATRKAIVNAFLSANLEGTLEVTPQEVERAYAEGAHPFVGESLEAVRDRLRAWLVQRRVEAAVGRWVDSLGQRTPVRRLVSF